MHRAFPTPSLTCDVDTSLSLRRAVDLAWQRAASPVVEHAAVRVPGHVVPHVVRELRHLVHSHRLVQLSVYLHVALQLDDDPPAVRVEDVVPLLLIHVVLDHCHVALPSLAQPWQRVATVVADHAGRAVRLVALRPALPLAARAGVLTHAVHEAARSTVSWGVRVGGGR